MARGRRVFTAVVTALQLWGLPTSAWVSGDAHSIVARRQNRRIHSVSRWPKQQPPSLTRGVGLGLAPETALSPEVSPEASKASPARRRPWWPWLPQSVMTSVISLAIFAAVNFAPGIALAENELATLADGKFQPDLVSSECFATSCKLSTKRCFEDTDCKKGLMCTARCLGDSACITGCFARFGNEVLNDLLQCSIEDYKCINIAIMEPGNDALADAPQPPKSLEANFKPTSIEGTWYKVLGWNRQYDCFECQKNSFLGRGDEATAQVDVEFAMVAKKKGRSPISNPQRMREDMVFDRDPMAHRTAHTQGRMFGLTFWENWYVIGENKPSEPEFKFIYYTGKTLQNTYDGAFVYSRYPELPSGAMASVYRIAREAGMDPEKFCRIRNECFLKPTPALDATEVAIASLARDQGSLSPLGGLTLRAKTFWYDVLDYAEDPHSAARWMYDQQQRMIWDDSVRMRATSPAASTSSIPPVTTVPVSTSS